MADTESRPKQAIKRWLDSLPKPNTVNSSEYAAVYDLLIECELVREDEPFEMADAILDEFILVCKRMKSELIGYVNFVAD